MKRYKPIFEVNKIEPVHKTVFPDKDIHSTKDKNKKKDKDKKDRDDTFSDMVFGKKKHKEDTSKWKYVKIDEDLKLKDFTKHSGASDFTRDWIEVRRKIKGPGNKSAKIKSIKVNRKKDYITFIFKSAPTYDTVAKAVNPTDLSLSKNVKEYTQEIRILDFFKLAETKPGYQEKDITISEIKEILKVASIQVFCNCASFQYQGMNAIVTMFDASIHPETRMPKRWNAYHKDDNFLCKHLSLIFNSIDFHIPTFAGMINKYLKSK